jgi:hypothetical protein
MSDGSGALADTVNAHVAARAVATVNHSEQERRPR